MTRRDHHPHSEDTGLLGVDYGKESYCAIHFVGHQDVSSLPPTLITSFLDHAEELMMKTICKDSVIRATAERLRLKMGVGVENER